MSGWTTTGALVLGSVVALYLGRRALGRRSPYPLPPGPPGLPWFGNITGVDPRSPWVTYAGWAKIYGNLVYCRILGQEIVIINSEKIAKDLLEVRSQNYSDRPYLITVEMCGMGSNTVFLPYGDLWRLHRRFFHRTFRPDAAQRFIPAQHRKACHFLQQLFDTPKQLADHVFDYTTAVVMQSTYDYDPTTRDDELIKIVANALEIVVRAVRPDTALTVGAFPWLLHLPSWLPGMSFKRDMELARKYSKESLDRLFEYALQKVYQGDSVAPSMVHDAIQEIEKGTSPEETWMVGLKEAAGSAFLAASETSAAALMTFFMMMVMNQEAQEKAQAEIDAVVGDDRLPTVDDRPLLPFVDAIFRETLRYNPVAILAIPHIALHDDVYDGFHIPKGAVVLANLWAMAHDETRYPNPHMFIPERFLNEDGSLKPNDTEHITYGFGRRICAGRHLADTSLWGVIAKVLAVFKILRALDENGEEVPVKPLFSSGNVAHPLPFKYRIVPRSPWMDAKKLEQLITAGTA